MKKFLLSLATIAFASSFAMADDLCSVTFGTSGSVTQESVSSYEKSWQATDKEDQSKSWTVANFNNNNDSWADMIKCGRKNNTSVGSVATNFAIEGIVTDINLTIEKFNESGKVNAIKVYSSQDGTTWSEVASTSEDKYVASTKTLSISFSNTTANLYYKVDFDCASAKGNGVVWLSGITYVGVADTSGKKPAGLSFSANSASAAQGEAFTAPELSNPNNLPLTWTSSDENVATVDNAGNVTIVGGGTTVITAKFEGNDSFAEGNAHYTLTVLGKAKDITDLLGLCPNDKDQAIVGFPMTVVYVNGQSIYVIDNKGNATLLFNSNSYKKGDIIPAGWTATFSPFNTLPEFQMSETPAASGTAEVTYPDVKSVAMVDVNRVVVLKGVTFAEATPADKSNFDGTLSDESPVLFRNNFTIASVEAGTYDVTCAVAIFNSNLQIYPIAYAPAAVVTEPTAPDQISGTSAEGTSTWGEISGMPGLIFNLATKNDTVTVEFDVPEGMDSWLMINYNEGIETTTLTRAEESLWINLDDVKAAYPNAKVGTQLTLSATSEQYIYTLMPVWDNKADMGNMYLVEINIDHETGVEAIEAAGVAAEYYNLQGVRVLNPENGMYIKVVNGKSTKVIVK